MKPGIPWSVKGIEQQARAAAKQAARQSGMTIGEWLNSVIMESADGNDDLERRYRRPPYRPRQAHGAEQDGEDVTLRLEEIADQLHDMARHDSATALRPMGPDDAGHLRAIIERLDAHEQKTSNALGAMQEQLEQVSQRLGGEAGQAPAAPQTPDDVPGYRALEGALRNIIEHIEISETRTRDSIRSLQERLTQPAGESNDLSEVQQVEQRLRGLVEEARNAGGALDPNEGQAQLRLEMEQIAATVSQGSGHALADLANRLEQLEADTNRRFSERDEAAKSEAAALGERIAATEKRLEHLATIEESVAQLARSLKADRSEAGRRGDGPSPELRALQEGLNAVRASSEISDRRTQETLQAVHETLEQIVAKLAELEAEDEPDEGGIDEQPTAELTETPAEAVAEEPAVELAQEWAAEEISRESEAPVDQAEDVADDVTAMDTRAEGFVFPEQPTPEEADPEPSEEAQVAAHDEPAAETQAETSAAAEPSDPPVREDYIAAARRAAQMSSRKQNPLTSGFNKFSQSMSGGGAKADDTIEPRTQKRGFISSLFGRRKASPGDDANADGKKSKRKRLIFAGLVLLVAASAYGAQRNSDSLSDFVQFGKALPAVALNDNGNDNASGPEALSDIWPLGALTTASLAPADGRGVASLAALPENIGPESLRQAAIGGDAVAQFVVAGRYLDGRAVARNEGQAAQWYERAAEQGLAAAQYRLGSMYEHGRGRPVDRERALALYKQAAAVGNINAMHNLAVLKTDAAGRRDYALAASWFRKAAERGLKDSQFNLAVLHERGLGVPRNPENAVFWYSLAAVQGDEEAAAKAKALEAGLASDAARQVRVRLMDWRALPADQKANAVPVDDPSWQELS